MGSRAFKTLSADLVPHAETAEAHFSSLGYAVAREARDLGFPYTPTLVCKRKHTTLIVELGEQIFLARLRQWIAYARSAGRDTRVGMCIHVAVQISIEQHQQLKDLGIGLYCVDKGSVRELHPPADAAITIELPPLHEIPKRVRTLLGPCYEQFDRSQWREGFEDACQAFETEARRYLNTGSRRGRITILRKTGPTILPKKQINKMTMGQLAQTFSQIQSQTHKDAIVGKALRRINSDRVAVAHHKSKTSTERRLRENVGRHMWTIVQALKEMC